MLTLCAISAKRVQDMEIREEIGGYDRVIPSAERCVAHKEMWIE